MTKDAVFIMSRYFIIHCYYKASLGELNEYFVYWVMD